MSRTRLDKMVDEFAGEMKKRLREKSKQGWHGWDESWFDNYQVEKRIRKQVLDDCLLGRLNETAFKRIDPIDLANYCAFLDLKHKESSND